MIKHPLYRQSFLFITLSFMLWVIYSIAVHYTVVLTHEVLQADPNNKGWTHWVYELYPRLQTEKWRFSNSFFLSKATQLLIRITLVLNIILGLYIYKIFISKKITNTYHRLIDQSIQRKFIPYITILLYTCLLLVVYNAIIEFKALILFSPFYKPTGIGKLFLPAFPSLFILWLIYSALIGSIIAVIVFPKKWMASSIAVIAFIYYQLILFGFGKYDHGYSTLTYALLIYPFFLWETEQSKENSVPAWSIVLIQWMICLSYFYCGLEKIFTSGPEWFYGDNLQQHLLIHETTLGLQLASYPILCKFLSFGVVALQLSFIALPFRKNLVYILLPSGILFHTAAWLLLDAGGLFNPWWGVYLFFLFPLQPQETK
jgi:hypothetical protein